MTRSDLEVAGQLLREHIVLPERPDSAVNARVALVERLTRARNRVWTWRLASVLAAAMAIAIPLGWMLRPSAQEAMSFSVGPEGRPGKLGAYVSPPANARWDIAFSDGSRIALEPLSHGRVTRTTARGAEVLLEDGRARVDVVRRPKANWSVIAGPYTVLVTGTSFDVSFDPRTQTLEVLMRTGAVRVEGPGIASPVEIRGAQRFVHRAGAPDAPAPPGRTLLDAGETEAHLTDDVAVQSPGQPRSTVQPAAQPSSASRATSSWAELANQGNYLSVLEQAKEQGLSTSLGSAPASDLMALGHAARFLGRVDTASAAYRSVRTRFGSSAYAAGAAFFLGRMVESNPSQAVAWYERYAAEAPNGPWISEALGRRMVLLSKSGAKEAALEAARTYLLRFPRGPYAGVAREMTAEF